MVVTALLRARLQVNIAPTSKLKGAIPGGSAPLTRMAAQVMFVLFAVVAALWGAVLIRQRAHAHRLHGLMAVLVAFKALTLLSQAGMFQLIRTTGHPEGWNVAFYVFNFLRGILFFTVLFATELLLLLPHWGTGWVMQSAPAEWASCQVVQLHEQNRLVHNAGLSCRVVFIVRLSC